MARPLSIYKQSYIFEVLFGLQTIIDSLFLKILNGSVIKIVDLLETISFLFAYFVQTTL